MTIPYLIGKKVGQGGDVPSIGTFHLSCYGEDITISEGGTEVGGGFHLVFDGDSEGDALDAEGGY